MDFSRQGRIVMSDDEPPAGGDGAYSEEIIEDYDVSVGGSEGCEGEGDRQSPGFGVGEFDPDREAVQVEGREVREEGSALLARLRREGVFRAGVVAKAGEGERRLTTGIDKLDRLLEGGVPRGRVVEVQVGVSSGWTGVMWRWMGGATAAGEQVVLVDPEEAFDPDGAAAAGVRLERVLWVRPRGGAGALRVADEVLGAGGFGLVIVDGGGHPGWGERPNWMRLGLRAERSGSVLVVAGGERSVGSFGALALRVVRGRARWTGEEVCLLDGAEVWLEVLRSRVRGVGEGVRLAVERTGRRHAA